MAKAGPTPKADEDFVGVIDEYCALDAELAQLKPRQARLKVLEEKIRAKAEEYPAAAGILFEGRTGAVQLTPAGNKRRFASMAKLFSLLGKANFLAHCSFTLTAAEKLLDGPQLAKVIVEDLNVGPRTVRPMLRAASKAA